MGVYTHQQQHALMAEQLAHCPALHFAAAALLLVLPACLQASARWGLCLVTVG